jgi:hypothetical protein
MLQLSVSLPWNPRVACDGFWRKVCSFSPSMPPDAHCRCAGVPALGSRHTGTPRIHEPQSLSQPRQNPLGRAPHNAKGNSPTIFYKFEQKCSAKNFGPAHPLSHAVADLPPLWRVGHNDGELFLPFRIRGLGFSSPWLDPRAPCGGFKGGGCWFPRVLFPRSRVAGALTGGAVGVRKPVLRHTPLLPTLLHRAPHHLPQQLFRAKWLQQCENSPSAQALPFTSPAPGALPHAARSLHTLVPQPAPPPRAA